MSRKTWGAAELAELAAVRPGNHQAIARHAARHGRTHGAVAAKLQVLRVRGAAEDVPRQMSERFRRQVRLTHPGGSL